MKTKILRMLEVTGQDLTKGFSFVVWRMITQ